MTQTFMAVLVIIAVLGTALAFSWLSPFRALEDHGRIGTWFYHEEDLDPGDRPDPSVNDTPIPWRRLRGRD